MESGRPRSSSKATAEDGGGAGWGKLDHHCLVGPFDAQNNQRPQAPGKATHSQVSGCLCPPLHLAQAWAATSGPLGPVLKASARSGDPCEQAPDGGPCISSSLHAVQSRDTDRSTGSLRRCLHFSSWEGCVGDERSQPPVRVPVPLESAPCLWVRAGLSVRIRVRLRSGSGLGLGLGSVQGLPWWLRW